MLKYCNVCYWFGETKNKCPDCDNEKCIDIGKGYYLQELKGTFDRSNLFEIKENDEIIYLAHSWAIPDCSITKYIMPEHKDFSLHWYKGEALTFDGYSYGGHHLGRITQIRKEEVEEILSKAKENVDDKIIP